MSKKLSDIAVVFRAPLAEGYHRLTLRYLGALLTACFGQTNFAQG